MIKKGIYLAGVLTKDSKNKVYCVVEYKYDINDIGSATAEMRMLTKEQLIGGMQKGIKLENIAFTDEVKKNAIKGIRKPLAEIETSPGYIRESKWVDGRHEFGNSLKLVYALGVVDRDANKVLAVTCTLYHRYRNNTSVDIKIEMKTANEIWIGSKSSVFANFNIRRADVTHLIVVGAGSELPMLSSDIEEMEISNNLVDYIAQTREFLNVADKQMDDEDFALSLADAIIGVKDSAVKMAAEAVEKFRNTAVETVVYPDANILVAIDAKREFSTNTTGISALDSEHITKMRDTRVITALACKPVDVSEVGGILTDVLRKTFVWNNVMLVPCDNGCILIDMDSKKVMKAIKENIDNLSEFIIDRIAEVGETIRETTERIELIRNNRMKSVELDSEDRITKNFVIGVVGFVNSGKTGSGHLSGYRYNREKVSIPRISISYDGTKLVSATDGTTRVYGELDFSLPGIRTEYEAEIRVNREATLELAKLFKEHSAELKELAKHNKCGLLAAGPYIGKDLVNREEDDVELLCVDNMNRLFMYISGNKEADVRSRRSYNDMNTERITVDGKMTHSEIVQRTFESVNRLGVMTIRHRDGWKVVLNNRNTARINTIGGIFRQAYHIMNNDATDRLMGRNRAVSESTYKGCIKAVFDKFGVNTIPSVGVAAALAGVVVAAESLDYYDKFKVFGKSVSTDLVIPYWNTVEHDCTFDMYEHTDVFNQVMAGIKEKKDTIVIKVKTLEAAIEACRVKMV